MNLYREDLNKGGWYSFNSSKEEWKSNFAEKMLRHFFDIELIEKRFRGFTINEEILLTKNNYLTKSGDKK